MITILLPPLLSFIITTLSIQPLLDILHKHKLYDIPDQRKKHPRITPTLGGISIFLGFIFTWLLFAASFDNQSFQLWMFSIITIIITGIVDDLSPLSPAKKLFAQTIAAIPLTLIPATPLFDFSSLISEGQYIFGLLEKVSFTFICIIIINAFNFIDGLDGLACSFGIICCIFFGVWFYINGQETMFMTVSALFGSLLGFLRFNLHPAKLFMGDTGSLFIGLLISIFFIQLFQLTQENPGEPIDVTLYHKNKLIMGIAFLLVPLSDLLKVCFLRIIRGSSPFLADRQHIHFQLLNLGWRPSNIIIFLSASNILIVLTLTGLQFAGVRFYYYHLLILAFMIYILQSVPYFISRGVIKHTAKNSCNKTNLQT